MPERLQGFVQHQIDTGGAIISAWVKGDGNPLLMLHGYPETHLMWHKVAPTLSEQYTVVIPDLRGYGESSCPETTVDHYPYSKKAMAEDMACVMERLGYDTFFLVGHDRGARVSHQLAVDFPDRVRKCMLLDILSTLDLYERTDMWFASKYYHWFLFLQPYDLPERLLKGNMDAYIKHSLGSFSSDPRLYPADVVEAYIQSFETPGHIHASVEDYRAGGTIDLEHQRADRAAGRKILCPLRVLWGEKGVMSHYDVLNIWGECADQVDGWAVKDSGHFIPEEKPDEIIKALKEFCH